MLRKSLLLFSVALPTALLASPAQAQVEITDAQISPVSTGTANGGSASDVIIRSGGSVLIGTGDTALTINSGNTVTNEGNIGSNDADNTTGILISGGNTGSFSNASTINLVEDYTATDTDGDGDIDGPLALGTGRTGILIAGPGAFTGDVGGIGGSSMRIEGNNSAAIRVNTALVGDLTMAGTAVVVGDNTFALRTDADITGNIVHSGVTTVTGDAASGLSIGGDVTGAISNTGRITASGFRSQVRGATTADRAKLDADDLLNGGPAVAIGGNVTGGLLNGAIRDANDIILSQGSINAVGSSPALLISPSVNGLAGGDITLGAVGLAADGQDYGIINEGTINGAGLNDGFAATAIKVEGSTIGGILRKAIIENGILNTGTISSSAFEAGSQTVVIGNGGVVDTFKNAGKISNTIISQTADDAIGIAVETGGTLNTITNTSLLEATLSGSASGAQAIGIKDVSGSVTLVSNQGTIRAIYNETLPTGVSADPNDTTRRTVAIDLAANTSGATISQSLSTIADATAPVITGDVLLGSGDDLVDLSSGTLTGDILFGAGNDTLRLDGGSTVSGAIFDADGQLVLDIRDGLLVLGGDTMLNLTSASFGPDARLQLTLSNSATGIIGATFSSSGAVTIADGAAIAPVLSELIGQGGQFTFVNAGSLSIGGSLTSLLDTTSLPYLYDVSLSQPGGGNTLVLNLQRRTAAQLGFDANQSAAYEPWFNALINGNDTELERGFAQITSQSDFFDAFNQVLPNFGAAALQFTRANTDGATGAVASRLDNVRRGYGKQGGLWAQEIGYYLDRNKSSVSQPYHGYGLGVSVGIDRPFGPFDAVGIALTGFSNELKEDAGFDKPLSSKSGQVSIYTGAHAGALDFESNLALGITDFDSERLLKFSGIQRTSKASWTGHHIAGTSRLSYDMAIGKWLFRPSVSLDYLRLSEGGYIETGGGSGFDLDVDRRKVTSLSGSAAFTFGRKFGDPAEIWWAPRLRLGVSNDFKGSTITTRARFAGFTQTFALAPQSLSKTALLGGFSLSAGSRFTSFGFDYDAEIRNGYVRHTGRLVIRFIF